MKYVAPAVLVVAMSAVGTAGAEEALNFEDEATRINYSLGFQIGGDFKRQGLEMNSEAVIQGMQDALSDAEPKMSADDMRATLIEVKKQVVADQKKRRVERELEMLGEGKKFLEENAKKEGVVITESGLQYTIIEEGSGKSPGPSDKVTVHYRGTLIDGTEFDSSHKRGKPASFKLNAVIKGWSEGLQLMKEGGKAQFFIPQELAYGQRGPLAHRTLIFDVELISVGAEAQGEAPAEAPAEGGEKAAE